MKRNHIPGPFKVTFSPQHDLNLNCVGRNVARSKGLPTYVVVYIHAQNNRCITAPLSHDPRRYNCFFQA